ncbi:MAG: toprim domain-containing protein [Clostridiales bacterium]|nr:toprim domain-containing protein [Clostridiales bacterium]
MKTVYITEKPSQAQDYVKALGINGQRRDGYVEGGDTIVTWCVGHLVTMSYPEKYDPAMKKWRLDTLPFIPEQYKYEVIGNVKKTVPGREDPAHTG